MYIIPETILVTKQVAATASVFLQLQTTLIRQTKYKVLKLTWMANNLGWQITNCFYSPSSEKELKVQ